MFGLSRLALQLVASGGIAALLVSSCVVRDRNVEQRGAQKVVAASKAQGAKANAINENVRRRAAEPGASDRLLNGSCRDC